MESAVERVRRQARDGSLRITQHAAVEMGEDDVALHDLVHALEWCEVLEDYPEHRRGSRCLVFGMTRAGRPLHVVCTTALDVLVIITVYEPPPRWITPTTRGASA